MLQPLLTGRCPLHLNSMAEPPVEFMGNAFIAAARGPNIQKGIAIV